MSKDIMNSITRSFGKFGFQCKKHAPEVLVVVGIAGVVTSTVMACKATTKASEIAKEHNDAMDQIHKVAETASTEEYSPEDLRNDTRIVYTQTALKYIKLYGPAVLIGTASIACILGSHVMLNKRNVALAAAYATVDQSFKNYRGRVVERFGKELDKELKYNIKSEEFEETVIDSKGKEKTVKKTVQVVDDPNQYSDYARIFDESCVGWCKDAEANLNFLRMQQSFANEKLKAQGYLLLNDVYEMLGFQTTKTGMVVGWIYDEKDPVGDNYVDFGIYNVNRKKAREFVNGYERSIILDFNVDGNIYEMM